MDPTQISTMAYYRGLEITLGSLCALAVNLLFHTPSAKYSLQKNNAALINQINQISKACFNLYLFGKKNPEFKSDLQALLKLIDIQTTLLRFIKHENIFNPKKKSGNQSSNQSDNNGLDLFIFSAQELLAELYNSYQGASEKIVAIFQQELTSLQASIQNTFEDLAELSNQKLNKKLNKNLNKKNIILWEQSLLELMTKAEQFRDQQAQNFSIPELSEWHEFLVRQEELLELFKDFDKKNYEPKTLNSRLILSSSRLGKQIFHRDKYYWEYAFKTALFAVLLPFIAVYWDLSGAVMLGVVIIITMQFDLRVTKRKLFLLVSGSFVGTSLALLLISFNLTQVWIYLACIFILSFFIGYIYHGHEKRSFFGLFVALTFLAGVTLGMGPIQDWRNTIILFFELIIAAVLLLIILI